MHCTTSPLPKLKNKLARVPRGPEKLVSGQSSRQIGGARDVPARCALMARGARKIFTRGLLRRCCARDGRTPNASRCSAATTLVPAYGVRPLAGALGRGVRFARVL